ncbi:hypothetical protein LCGC14_2139230 [marine sediment metagenome]|uniref:Uncharacterized protein n=1 Tax=marine sediment metagenome TaxID=412755 RepID=A0A0F9EL50_9ZZZZ
MSKIIYDFELEKFKKAWHTLSGHRKITNLDRLKVIQAITLLHGSIDELTQNAEEVNFCHHNLYKKFLNYISDDFDYTMAKINKLPTGMYKFDRLLGWSNKEARVEKFVLHLLAQYDGKIVEEKTEATDPFGDEWWSKHYDKATYFGNDEYHLLMVDQFGRYYVGPGKENRLLIIEHGKEMAIDYTAFMKKTRPKAHGVNVTYILRRLLVKDDLREHQLRFVRRFAKGDLKNNILSRQGGGVQKADGRRVLKVQRKRNSN